MPLTRTPLIYFLLCYRRGKWRQRSYWAVIGENKSLMRYIIRQFVILSESGMLGAVISVNVWLFTAELKWITGLDIFKAGTRQPTDFKAKQSNSNARQRLRNYQNLNKIIISSEQHCESHHRGNENHLHELTIFYSLILIQACKVSHYEWMNLITKRFVWQTLCDKRRGQRTEGREKQFMI